MKKLLVLLLAVGCLAPWAAYANDTTGHTFFTVSPIFRYAYGEKISLLYDRLVAKKDGLHGFVQAVPFVSSSNNGFQVAKFFMPFGKTTLVAGEFNSPAAQDGSIDLMANYFGVLTRPVDQVYGGATTDYSGLTYQSLIRMKPEQHVTGLGLTYKQKLTHHADPDKGLWVYLNTSIQRVVNNLNFKETQVKPGGGKVPQGFVGTITQALTGEPVFGEHVFKYGKICCGSMSKTGFSDIELYFGFDNHQCACKTVYNTFYGGIIIPTGNKPNAEYIFQPIVGNNKHFGLVFGTEVCYEFWRNTDNSKNLWFNMTAYSQYLIRNTQKRSFDLIDKQWSRYIWLYEEQLGATDIYQITPGINSLTADVHVFPRSLAYANSSLVFEDSKGYIIEAGYGAYYRQEEIVSLACPFPTTLFIVGIDQSNPALFASKSNATARRYTEQQSILVDLDQPSGNPGPVAITEGDLNLQSAAHPAVVSHCAFATVGYRWEDLRFPTLASIGGSYEFPSDNTALQRWVLWLKAVVSF